MYGLSIAYDFIQNISEFLIEKNFWIFLPRRNPEFIVDEYMGKFSFKILFFSRGEVATLISIYKTWNEIL